MVVRLGFGLLVAQLRLVARGFHGLVGRLIIGGVFSGGLFGGGLEGGRGLLVDRVGEDLAQVRGNLRRGARREGLGVEFFEDFDGDDLAGHVEGRQAGRLLVVLAGHVAPGHGEKWTRDDLQDLLADSVNEVGSQVLGDRVSELSGYEVTILELKQGHRSFLHVYGALVAIVSYVPKEARTTQAHCGRYHVIIRR